jgi:hypothetical protein
MTIEDNPSPAGEEESSEDDDVEDDTYWPSPQAPTHGSGAAEEEEEIFDVEEIIPTSYMHMGIPIFQQHLNQKKKRSLM